MNITGSQAPPRILQYGALIDSIAPVYGLDPGLVGAIMDRETNGGESKDLDRPGPSGTGDFGKRNPQRWQFELPPDGRGWGRGLMQVDFGSNAAWCLQVAPDGLFCWEHPEENIKRGCQILHAKCSAVINVSRGFTTVAAICAYNAGEGSVFRVFGTLAGGAITADSIVKALDMVTAGGDYVSDVLRRRNAFAAPP